MSDQDHMWIYKLSDGDMESFTYWAEGIMQAKTPGQLTDAVFKFLRRTKELREREEIK